MSKMGFGTDKRFARDFNNRSETVAIGGKVCNFRSQLEKQFAEQYLEVLKKAGYLQEWWHEFTTFHFPDDKYIPDFEVRNNDNTFEYFETKGHWDSRAKRKLTLLNKYRPEVQITLVFKSKKMLTKLVRNTHQCARGFVFSED